MHEPRSIFTGRSTPPSTCQSLPRAENRRLSTPEYRESLNGVPASSPTAENIDDRHNGPLHPSWATEDRSGRPAPPSSSAPAPNHSAKSPPLFHTAPPVARKRKRSFARARSATNSPEALVPSLFKRRRRTLYTRAPHTLHRLESTGVEDSLQPPPSPLFFSHHDQQRPRLPPRFSSSEAAASMLSKAKGEDSNIKTVTLARGTLGRPSPPNYTSAPAYLGGEKSGPGEGAERGDSLRFLGAIGVVELLENDSRPTLIIDLHGVYNYGPGALRPIFANNALRAESGLFDRILDSRPPGATPGEELSKTAATFKGWALSAVVHGEALDASLPPIDHAGFSWSCTTLRKRIRVVSGTREASMSSRAGSTAPMTDYQVSAGSGPLSERESRSSTSSSAQHDLSATSSYQRTDYFGNVVNKLPATEEDEELVDAESEYNDAKTIIEAPRPTHIIPSLQDRVRNDATLTDHLGSHPSLANECVLRAAVAGDVDWFSRVPSPHRDLGGFFDWTRLPISDNLPRHIRFALSVDWTSTPLGPIETWSADLRQMCNLVMASPHPAAFYYGPELVAIYNEAYVLLAGQKHPTLMGQSYHVAWAEIWDDVKQSFADARSTGQATMKDDDCLFIKRADYLEETYFSWSIIPMVGPDGKVSGLYNPAFEKTRRKIAERRMLTLREVGERTAAAREVKSFWREVLGALETNHHDTPFILLYSVSDESDSDSSSIHSSSLLGTKQCHLEGSLGVPEGHPAAPPQLELKTDMEGFTPIFREVMKTDKPVQLKIGDGADISPSMMDGIEWRGFGDPCREVIVCPIHPTTGESVLGFLVMGVNPRRQYDDDYSLFIQLLSRQLATSLASVVLFEEEIRRGQRAAKLAALDRMELSEQLKDVEQRMTRMAESSAVGLFIADSNGTLTYCNETWYEVTRVPRDPLSTTKWIDAVFGDDQAKVRDLWSKVVERREEVTAAEFRFKTPWVDRNGARSETWVLFSAYPELSDRNDKLKSVFGSITNISPQKWAEGFQKRKMEEAIELKRQQENFIDITSHEMRNPLSAILQCADEITTTLSEFRNSGAESISADLVTGSIDAAQTISLCALHQKRIVDDVLTLSKLDSAMLQVTPVDAQPLGVIQRALRMFEGEVQTADIKLDFVVDKSYHDLNIDWVRMDPSRVLQVLINLTTNAIKFTTTEEQRTITVSIAAYSEPPSATNSPLVKFFPQRPNRRVLPIDGPDWGDGEIVYLQFAVQDTGRGLNDDEKKLLFLRFSQASPRTHVQYGGSGLGLFISRELTELQGGEIGVASEAGRGSTFAFYVKCHKTDTPQDPLEQLPNMIPRQLSTSSDSSRPKSIEPATKTRDFAVSAAAVNKAVGKAADLTVEDRARIKVLIVEDNLVNQKVLQKQLRNKGFDVSVANHGGEALDLLKQSTFWRHSSKSATEFSVLLMDQEMPVMDGLQCTKEIRELERQGEFVRHIPIIAVTANARAAQIQALMEVGMDDVVSKPFRIPELVPKIEQQAFKHAAP